LTLSEMCSVTRRPSFETNRRGPNEWSPALSDVHPG
jgi:hypothetical protein